MFSSTKGYKTKPPVGVRLNPLHPLSRGLVGCWLFNEGAGSVAHDISGNGNHGTLKSMGTNAQSSGWGGSKFGGGLDFDGSNDYVDLDVDFASLFSTAYTVEFWLNSADVEGDIIGDFNASPYPFMVRQRSNGMQVWINLTQEITYPYVPVSGLNHWMVTHVGEETLTLYRNGVSVGTASTVSLPGSGGNLQLGFVSGSGYYLGGSADSAQIYNRALSAVEAKQRYEDPFCNLLRVPVRYAPAAPGGLPIPVAMNYYRRRRVA